LKILLSYIIGIFLAERNICAVSFARIRGEQKHISKCCPINVLFKDPVNYIPVENGESFEQLFARTGEFLEQAVRPQLEDGKDVLIVGHGAMNSSIVCQIKNEPLENFWKAGIKNCKLMKLI